MSLERQSESKEKQLLQIIDAQAVVIIAMGNGIPVKPTELALVVPYKLLNALEDFRRGAIDGQTLLETIHINLNSGEDGIEIAHNISRLH